ncbi:MAG: DNA repair protein RecN [Thiotrichales bacterium]|nr:DNA repair protein RecN [Thiotrichales bacterium]
MLYELSIQNLALIEQLTLNFRHGFSTLTGETGAGKSILLDALGLALGERADSTLVRHGAERADVTAAFDIEKRPSLKQWLVENELDDQNHCLLRRTLSVEGRSKAYINGIPVAVGQLKALSSRLIDIHGQHEHQSLLNPLQQLELLDAFASHAELRQRTYHHYQQWRALQKQLHEQEKQQQDRQSRLELLRFQQQEFAELQPKVGEFADLEQQQSQLSHASEIKQSGVSAYQFLEEEHGVTDQLNRALMQLESIVDFSPLFAGPLAQLQSALIEIQEAASDIQSLADRVEIDPLQLQSVEERLNQLFAVAKKYQLQPETLCQKQQQIEQELSRLQDKAHSIDHLQQAIEQQEATFYQYAQQLHQQRKQAAKELSQRISLGMRELGMAHGQFEVIIHPAKTPSAQGLDSIEFHVSANKGQPLQALAKVASGGELSRISLAIQVATAEVTELPTLIFDEVDVGIGGGVAEVVGEKMQQLGRSKQLLSITHLAQVAAHGDHHFKIAKRVVDEQTRTEVSCLDTHQRIQELARMLGGVTITEQTEKMAAELLQQAQQKQQLSR